MLDVNPSLVYRVARRQATSRRVTEKILELIGEVESVA